ncbi:DUF2586 domain-containing protein [Candidatus Thiothrix sp. Deng01]|uniref:DUF2586 domain-containing protein n=1 Tax=Candidatus Thiothrix phosphatis TaxID=3112415 RepID=A0ABU6D1V1_9GAMM|nr:DUF2586 domain-containing protein [Candidatus Thiothrix sp. Deng01]MEB4592985.1 DUF2586 domain-containing protein [Candidatus Thiothrix sp. Deng01]
MRGTVSVNNLNLSQGEFPEIERKFLFIGVGGNPDNLGKTLSLGNASDLDGLLGDADSPLKTNLAAARLNAGDNWFAWALPVAADDDNADLLAAFDEAMATAFRGTSPEAVVVLRTAQTAAEISAWHDKLMELRGATGRQMFAILAVPGCLQTQTWADYEAATTALVAPLAANRVMAVPQLHGNNVGVIAGRLCDRSVGVADTPMRVETGPLLGLGLGEEPVDADGRLLDESTLMALDAARLSVPQHYADYPGTYWADGNLLETPAGDFQVVEYLRPVLKACRAVRILAIGRIGNKNFNDTPDSMAWHKHHFARPLREMSKTATVEVGGQKLPLVGDIMPPGAGSVVIQWVSMTRVNLVLVVKPYRCPKQIVTSIALDLSGEL